MNKLDVYLRGVTKVIYHMESKIVVVCLNLFNFFNMYCLFHSGDRTACKVSAPLLDLTSRGLTMCEPMYMW